VIVLPGGDLLIADASLHRVRKVEAASGVIRTLVGTGPAGYSGDGGAARGVRLTATVPAGGFTSNDAQVEVRRSEFRVFLPAGRRSAGPRPPTAWVSSRPASDAAIASPER